MAPATSLLARRRARSLVAALLSTLSLVVSLLAGRAALAAAPPDEVSELDLSTPRRAVGTFLNAVESRDFERAARVLDLRSIPVASRADRGPEAARELAVVLDRIAWIELDLLSDEPAGDPSDGVNSERIAAARVGRHEVMITLARSPTNAEWRFSAATVTRIPQLYEEHGPGALERRVPSFLRSGRLWSLAPWQWISLPVLGLVAFMGGVVLTVAMIRIARRFSRRTATTWDDAFVVAFGGPLRYFLAAVLFRFLVEPLGLSAAATHVFGRLVGIATIASIAWVAIRAVTVLAKWLEARARRGAAGASTEHELRARGLATQVRVFRRVINVGIALLAAALMLVQFELVRNIGVSLLASAGLAGVVLGFAAQRTFGSLIAGIQLSVTQPIRIGDVVIVEKEWGTIEEVTLTYVVVRVWDERRLLVPVSRFLEQPFENWTKTSAELHGTIYFHVDWTFPVEAMREELARILTDHPRWDGRTKGVVVTDATPRTLEVRVLVSAADAGKLWDLRVDVRERLVRWLQELEGGRYLPRLRHEELAPPLTRP